MKIYINKPLLSTLCRECRHNHCYHYKDLQIQFSSEVSACSAENPPISHPERKSQNPHFFRLITITLDFVGVLYWVLYRRGLNRVGLKTPSCLKYNSSESAFPLSFKACTLVDQCIVQVWHLHLPFSIAEENKKKNTKYHKKKKIYQSDMRHFCFIKAISSQKQT